MARLRPAFDFGEVARDTLLEEPLERADVADGAIAIPYRPFEIITLVVT
jgi:hypothetical protein